VSPGEAAAATVIVICAAVYVAYRILCWLLDRSIRARREEDLELDRWQQTAADAARATHAADAAAAIRKEREIAELYAMCPDVIRVIELPNPRRTEEGQ
jgi:hypothetical protein